MRLDRFDNSTFERGRPRWVEALWLGIQGMTFSSWLPGSAWRVSLLRAFGARIGRGVVIKPGVRVKFPWRLEVGDHSWIGESAWIDNLAPVEIGAHCCVSQGAYLCTGNHDWADERFALRAQPIRLHERVWVGAFARIAPGSVLGPGCVVSLGSVASGTLAAGMIHAGNPARPLRARAGAA